MFAQLATTWLGEKSADLRAPRGLLDGAPRLIAHRTEIERKYLLSGLPERVRGAESTVLDQGYLPGGVVRERLRRAVGPRGARFTRTVKLGTGVVRAEFEEELPESEFERLWPLTAGARLRKRRYLVPDGELTWETDGPRPRAVLRRSSCRPRTWSAFEGRALDVREVTDDPPSPTCGSHTRARRRGDGQSGVTARLRAPLQLRLLASALHFRSRAWQPIHDRVVSADRDRRRGSCEHSLEPVYDVRGGTDAQDTEPRLHSAPNPTSPCSTRVFRSSLKAMATDMRRIRSIRTRTT
jgi:hypothetical protein